MKLYYFYKNFEVIKLVNPVVLTISKYTVALNVPNRIKPSPSMKCKNCFSTIMWLVIQVEY